MRKIRATFKNIGQMVIHCKKSMYAQGHRSSLVFIIGLAIIATAGTQAWALDPALPPGDNFVLNNWYLGLPVDDQGGTSGDSESISAASLEAGFTNDYFYTGTDGSMVFWAPVNGATTGGSSFPRSELREQIVQGNNNINWSGYGFHLLTAQCKVTQIPSSQEVIIGQIHSKTGNARPLVKLYFDTSENYTVRANIKKFADDPDDSDQKYYFTNTGSLGLDDIINYSIEMVDGFLSITVNGQTKTHDAFASGTGWDDEEFYFKAGSYCQDNNGGSSEGARVAFYSLARSHSGAALPNLAVVSAYGSPTPLVGTNAYPLSTFINASVGSPLVDGTTRQLSTGWTGTGDVGSGSGTSTSFTLTQDSAITWQWQTQHYLDTEVSGPGIVSIPDTWLNAGSNVTITATPYFGEVFVGWTGDVISSNPVIIVTMDEAKSVTANFGTPAYLTVTSPHGSPSPGVGTSGYSAGTVINASMTGSPDVSGTTRHVATGWTGTGDVIAGSGTNTSFTLDQDSTLTWQWQTQYWLSTSVSGNGSVDISDDWFDAGSGVTITASPDEGHHFVIWSGDSSSTNPVLNLTMDAAKSVTAIFAVIPPPTLEKRFVQSVSASHTDGANIPENTLDGDFNTRWSGQGDGVTITYDLGASQNVHELKMAWYLGTARLYYFDVQMSTDGTNWTTVLAGQNSSALTLGLEIVNIPDTVGRYVRIVGHENSSNDWTSLTEVEIWGVPADLPAEVYMPLPVLVGGGVQFTVPSVSGALYQLEYTDALDPSSWGEMGAGVFGDGGDVILSDPGPLTTNRFYRMSILP